MNTATKTVADNAAMNEVKRNSIAWEYKYQLLSFMNEYETMEQYEHQKAALVAVASLRHLGAPIFFSPYRGLAPPAMCLSSSGLLNSLRCAHINEPHKLLFVGLSTKNFNRAIFFIKNRTKKYKSYVLFFLSKKR